MLTRNIDPFIVLIIFHSMQLLGMEKQISPPLLSQSSCEQYHTIGDYLEESQILTCLVAQLSELGKNPTYLTTPYCILHLETLTRLVQKHPKIKSLTPETFIETSFALAYEFVYNERAPLMPSDELKSITLLDLHKCLELIVSKRCTELDACKNRDRK